VKVQTSFNGNGLFTQRQRVFERHRLRVAPGTMTCEAGAPWWLEIIHTGTNKLRPSNGMSLGTIEACEGNITVVTPEQWEKFLHEDPPPVSVGKPKPITNRENDPPIATANVPNHLRCCGHGGEQLLSTPPPCPWHLPSPGGGCRHREGGVRPPNAG